MLITVFLGKVSTVLKCWFEWQSEMTTVQQHQEGRAAALFVEEVNPAVKWIREAEAAGRERRILEARRLNRRFTLLAMQYR